MTAEAPRPGSPLVRRRRLGTELRRLREGAGYGIREVADELELSMSTVSRYETGRSTIRVRDLRFLLDHYEVNDEEERTRLFELAKQGHERGWWHDYSDVLLSPLLTYVGLESEAASICEVQSHMFPGLLQLESYARAVLKMSYATASDEECDRLVALRMARQKVTQDHLDHAVILDEGVIMRPVGGVECLRNQLSFVLDRMRDSALSVRLIEFSVGEHPAIQGGFNILRFDDANGADPVVFLESLSGGIYLERLDDVARYIEVFDELNSIALSERDTERLIFRRLQDLRGRR